ncbi:hypothetical protein RCL1_009030 [Eukaryota sp. TZLM3-RCL]
MVFSEVPVLSQISSIEVSSFNPRVTVLESLNKLGSFHNLRNLSLGSHQFQLSSLLPQVRSLKYKRVSGDNNLLSYLPNLESLEIVSHSSEPSTFPLSSIRTPLKLSVLKISCLIIPDIDLISNFINLEVLELKNCRQPDNKLLKVVESMIQPLTRLKKCNISGLFY